MMWEIALVGHDSEFSDAEPDKREDSRDEHHTSRRIIRTLLLGFFQSIMNSKWARVCWELTSQEAHVDNDPVDVDGLDHIHWNWWTRQNCATKLTTSVSSSGPTTKTKLDDERKITGSDPQTELLQLHVIDSQIPEIALKKCRFVWSQCDAKDFLSDCVHLWMTAKKLTSYVNSDLCKLDWRDVWQVNYWSEL